MTEFLQQQINELQIEQTSVKERVKEAAEAAYDNKKTLKALHGRIDGVEADLADVKASMITADQFEVMLENSFNKQFVNGMKYIAGSCIAFVLAAWADVIAWFNR